MAKRKEEREVLDTFAEYGADPEVLREWDLTVERARKVRGVLKLKTPSGYRMLKKVNVSAGRLRFIHEATEHLARGGFTQVPRFIRTKYGDPFVVQPDGLYYLTDWLPGKEADLKKPRNLFLAAETLACFHNAGTGSADAAFGQESREDFTAQWGKYRAKLTSYDQSLTETTERNEMDVLYQTHRDDLYRMIAHASEQLEQSPYRDVLEWARTNRSICHGSFSRQNLIVDRERLAVVDFDHCHVGHPIHDLGALLARYLPRNEWDAEIGFAVIDVYRGVRELSEEEVTVLAAYLSFPQKTLAVVEAYFERTRDWDAHKFAKRFQKSLQLDSGRETFVQEIIARYGLSMSAPTFAPLIEGMVEEYEEGDEYESSSIEAREDRWEEQEVDSAAPLHVDVETEEPNVTLAGFDADEGDEAADATPRQSLKNARPKAKRPEPRRGTQPGLWTPKQ